MSPRRGGSPTPGPHRKYYAITDQGRRALADFSTEWRGFRDAVDDILSKGATS
jgi:DNA-binding PadR family transcriptional regulator